MDQIRRSSVSQNKTQRHRFAVGLPANCKSWDQSPWLLVLILFRLILIARSGLQNMSNEILDRLKEEHKQIFDLILYVEQPFPYDH